MSLEVSEVLIYDYVLPLHKGRSKYVAYAVECGSHHFFQHELDIAHSTVVINFVALSPDDAVLPQVVFPNLLVEVNCVRPVDIKYLVAGRVLLGCCVDVVVYARQDCVERVFAVVIYFLIF